MLGEKVTSMESLRVPISKFPGHMRSIKLLNLKFSASVLTLRLKAKFSKI